MNKKRKAIQVSWKNVDDYYLVKAYAKLEGRPVANFVKYAIDVRMKQNPKKLREAIENARLLVNGATGDDLSDNQ